MQSPTLSVIGFAAQITLTRQLKEELRNQLRENLLNDLKVQIEEAKSDIQEKMSLEFEMWKKETEDSLRFNLHDEISRQLYNELYEKLCDQVRKETWISVPE